MRFAIVWVLPVPGGPCTTSGLDHGVDYLGMLAHPQVVVGAPDHDVAGAARRMPNRARKAPGVPLDISKHPVATLVASGEGAGSVRGWGHGPDGRSSPAETSPN